MNGKYNVLVKPAFVSIGSNIEPEKHIPLAVANLSSLGGPVSVSLVYQNPAIGRPEQADYLNAAARILTLKSAIEIRGMLRQIEEDLGRVRSDDKYAPRTMDLDLCLLGDRVIKTDEIVLPDPNLIKFAHVAVPIAELDPEFIHPVTRRSLQDIANGLRIKADLDLREYVSRHIHQVAEKTSLDN